MDEDDRSVSSAWRRSNRIVAKASQTRKKSIAEEFLELQSLCSPKKPAATTTPAKKKLKFADSTPQSAPPESVPNNDPKIDNEFEGKMLYQKEWTGNLDQKLAAAFEARPEPAWLNAMEEWLQTVPHGRQLVTLNQWAAQKVTGRARMLVAGIGILNQSQKLGYVFCEGVEINFATDFDQLLRKADEDSNRNKVKSPFDTTNIIKGTLTRLQLYQRHCAAKEPEAAEPIPAPETVPSVATTTPADATGRLEKTEIPVEKIINDATCFMIALDVPGYIAGNVDVSMDEPREESNGMMLTISGSRSNRLYKATFRRQVHLCDNELRLDKVEAELVDGLLTITVPKWDMSKFPKEIPVRTAPLETVNDNEGTGTDAIHAGTAGEAIQLDPVVSMNEGSSSVVH